jgi:hypothetical protein
MYWTWEVDQAIEAITNIPPLNSSSSKVFNCLTTSMLSRLNERVLRTGEDFFLFPVCEDKHYVLFILSIKCETVLYVDSLNGYFDEEFVHEMIKTIQAKAGIELKQWGNLYDEQKQFNDVDCAVYVISVIKAVRNNAPSTWPSSSLRYLKEMKVLLEEIRERDTRQLEGYFQ